MYLPWSYRHLVLLKRLHFKLKFKVRLLDCKMFTSIVVSEYSTETHSISTVPMLQCTITSDCTAVQSRVVVTSVGGVISYCWAGPVFSPSPPPHLTRHTQSLTVQLPAPYSTGYTGCKLCDNDFIKWNSLCCDCCCDCFMTSKYHDGMIKIYKLWYASFIYWIYVML